MSEPRIRQQGFSEYIYQRYDILKELGDCCAALGDFREAGDYYLQATRLFPGRSDAYTGLGLLAVRTGQLELAQQALNRAVELDPDSHAAWGGLATMHQQLGDLESAWLMYQRCMEKNAHDEMFLMGFFQTAWKLDRLESVRPLLAEHVRTCPESTNIAYCLGALLARMGEVDQAREVLEDLLQRDAEHDKARTLLAQVQQVASQTQEARSA
ncbi:MAG: tetratricopeptide repeat protein [Planctomycetota bacterium]